MFSFVYDQDEHLHQFVIIVWNVYKVRLNHHLHVKVHMDN